MSDETEGDPDDADEDDAPSTRETLDELGFYDNDVTEFPPELSGVKRFKAEGRAEPLVEALGLQGYDVGFMRLEMIEALGRIGDEAAVPALVDELGDGDTNVAAMEALARIGSADAVDEIAEKLDPEKRVEPRVRAAAADALGELGDDGAVDALVEILDSDSPRVRAAAADALGEIGDDGPVEALSGLLEADESEKVRASAAGALASIDTADARETLSEYDDDANELVRRAV
ncbi:MAG: HEAT repeat domain-containing protein [Halobacteriales archaeon]